MTKTIVIVVHRHADPFWSSTYTACHLAREWQRLGLRVLIAQGVAHREPGDIAVNHVDLTVTPVAYRDYLAQYPVVLNGALTDISKTRISAHLLRPTDDYRGPVIVKTRANFGGVNEAHVASQEASAPRRLARRASAVLSRARGWAAVRTLSSEDYPIFDSLRAVPRAIWRNGDLVVEKFLPEDDGAGNWRLRAWSFLGGRSLHVLTTASRPIVKGASIWRREILPDAVPPALVQMRERLGADYGRFDYGLVAGEPVIYDVNRTPTTSAPALHVYGAKLVELATGVLEY